ncbi:hypothetical protein BDB00DRAFT_848035 [Zychaea mexicana]|uniref:uncharacterized protein n=1 Tax=Zychaea mexicana TaxID=64656 RepID=UPI0022FF2C21|nr:uncharacterized protein BDB00DRAFT_848035 [Zychaea mexicana]KAI9488431.1 hypothetical protein BDB00DRAFT_848035 [Zychaea mexicana]
MPSALQTACNPFSHANSNAHHYSRWHPLFACVKCFYDGFIRHQGPLEQRRRPCSNMARSMYNLQRVIDQVMQNQLALEQLEHGLDDPATTTTALEGGQRGRRRDEAVMTVTPWSAVEDPVEKVHYDTSRHSNSTDAEKQQQKLVELLQAEHEQELQRLTEQHEAAFSRLTRQHEEATRRLRREQQQALDRIEQHYKDQLTEQEEMHQSRIHTVEQQLANEVLRKKQLDLLVRENGDEIKRIMTELVDQQDQVVALETKLAYRPPVRHAFVQTEQEEKEASVQVNDADVNDAGQKHKDAIEQQQQQHIQQLQEELLEQEERWQDKLTYYRNQVEIRMQQFYEQEYMVTRLQEHLQIIKEQLDKRKKQNTIREHRLLDMMDLVQQLREEKDELASQIMYYRQQQRKEGWGEEKHQRHRDNSSNGNGARKNRNGMQHQGTTTTTTTVATVPCTT